MVECAAGSSKFVDFCYCCLMVWKFLMFIFNFIHNILVCWSFALPTILYFVFFISTRSVVILFFYLRLEGALFSLCETFFLFCMLQIPFYAYRMCGYLDWNIMWNFLCCHFKRESVWVRFDWVTVSGCYWWSECESCFDRLLFQSISFAREGAHPIRQICGHAECFVFVFRYLQYEDFLLFKEIGTKYIQILIS